MKNPEWIFPVEDEDGVELAYANAIRSRRQGGSVRYIIGAVGVLSISERHIPLLRAFLDALEQAPLGTKVINCQQCGCPTVLVKEELMGTDNSGTECEEHDCTHSRRYPDPAPRPAPSDKSWIEMERSKP